MFIQLNFHRQEKYSWKKTQNYMAKQPSSENDRFRPETGNFFFWCFQTKNEIKFHCLDCLHFFHFDDDDNNSEEFRLFEFIRNKSDFYKKKQCLFLIPFHLFSITSVDDNDLDSGPRMKNDNDDDDDDKKIHFPNFIIYYYHHC